MSVQRQRQKICKFTVTISTFYTLIILMIKIMNIKNCIIIILSMMVSFHVSSQTFSNEFLSIGVGARSHGMARAQVSVVDDITSAYWNPAGLSNIDAFQLSYMHSEWFAGISKYDYGGVAFPFSNASSKSSLALNFIRFGVDNIPNTITFREPDGSFNFDNITQFSAVDYAFLVSYGRELKLKNVSVGGTAKIITRNIGSFANAAGFGIDLGAQWRGNNGWSAGLVLRDATSTFNSWKFTFSNDELAVFDFTENEVSSASTEVTKPSFVLSGAKKINFKGDKFGVLPVLDLEFTTDGRRNVLFQGNTISMQPSFGLEFDYKSIIYLRTGAGNFQTELEDIGLGERNTFQPNLGLGLKIGRVSIDYALTDIGNSSGALYSHIGSLKLDFGSVRLKKKDIELNNQDEYIILDQDDF